MRSLRNLAIVTLLVNVVVILLGALVRATGSGAGCGNSWPTCNGTVLPELEGATVIEFTHRASSGIALIMVAILLWLVFRHTRRGHPARLGAVVSGVSIVIEALIGAVIVLAELVADDASLARIVSVPIHLVSTFVLLGGLALTVFWIAGGGRLRVSERRELARPLVLIGVGFLLVGATGGVTALADTLFPKESFEVGSIFEASASESFLTNLRALHPMVALLVGAVAATWAWTKGRPAAGAAGRAATIVVGLVVVEIFLGVANVVLLTPTWLSLVHLAVADGLWVAWVWLAAELLQAGARAPA
jgi:heme A synthase